MATTKQPTPDRSDPRTWAVAKYKFYHGRRFVATGCTPECAKALAETAAAHGHREASAAGFIQESVNH